MRHAWRRAGHRLAALGLIWGALLASAGPLQPIGASQATPAARPESATCDVIPRAIEDILNLTAVTPDEVLEIGPLPEGEPADPASTAAIAATLEEMARLPHRRADAPLLRAAQRRVVAPLRGAGGGDHDLHHQHRPPRRRRARGLPRTVAGAAPARWTGDGRDVAPRRRRIAPGPEPGARCSFSWSGTGGGWWTRRSGWCGFQDANCRLRWRRWWDHRRGRSLMGGCRTARPRLASQCCVRLGSGVP